VNTAFAIIMGLFAVIMVFRIGYWIGHCRGWEECSEISELLERLERLTAKKKDKDRPEE